MPEETHTPDKDEKTKISKYQKLKTKKKSCLKKRKKLNGEKSFSSQRLSDLCGISPLLHFPLRVQTFYISARILCVLFFFLIADHLFFYHFLFLTFLAKVLQVIPRAGYRPTSSHRRSRRRLFCLVPGGRRVEFSATKKCHDFRGDSRPCLSGTQIERPHLPSETQTSEDPV